jgi:NAD(P)H dehydrogenase (quinone)
VRYRPESLAEAHASRARYHAEDWQREAWVSTYTAIANGELAVVSDAVERLLGRPATALADALLGLRPR